MISDIARPRANRADIWMAYFDPVVGHEQGGRRPAVIISGDVLHVIPSQLVFIVPVTSRMLGVRTHIPVRMADGNLAKDSFAMTEQLRAVSVQRLRRRIGSVDDATLSEIRRLIARFMDAEIVEIH